MQVCWHSLSPIRDIFNHFPMFSCANAALACHFPGCHATSAAADTRFRGRTGIIRGEIKLFCGRKKIFRGRIRRFRGSLYRTMQRMCQSTPVLHPQYSAPPTPCPAWTACDVPTNTVTWTAEEEARTGVQRQFSRCTVLFSHKLPESICAYAGFSVTLRLVGGRPCPSSMQNLAAATVQAHGSVARWKVSLQVPTIDLLYIL